MIADRAFWLDVKTTIHELFHPTPLEQPDVTTPEVIAKWVESHRRTDQWEIVPTEEEGA